MEATPMEASPMESPSPTTSTPTRTRRKSIGAGKSPEFDDPYDTRWQEQFDAAPLRPYKTKDEYLYAMREDLADWLNDLYHIDITPENFFEKLETGSILCQHANNVRRAAVEYKQTLASKEDPDDDVMNIGHAEIRFKPDAGEGTFLARDNISNFIHWCRHCLNIKDVLLFESDDLVLRKNTKSFILCLLEVARRGGKVGMPVPMLVQFEKEIEMELRNSINLSGMISLPSEKSDSLSLSTGPTSPSSSAATTDIEPESPSSGAELDPMSDSSYMSSLGRYSPDPLPPISKDVRSKSKSLPRPTHFKVPQKPRDKPTAPLRRNNSLRRPRQLPCIPPKSSENGNHVRGMESWLNRRAKTPTKGLSPNRHSLPTALDRSGGMQNGKEEEEEEYTGPQIMLQASILKSLDELVRDLVNRCTCPAQFPMIREAEGKYRIGENSTLIFVRILRNHVMVRVGGGWDTLEHYLDKHDPCRCQVHKKKKPHQRAHSQPGHVTPLRRSQSPVQRSQSPVQRTRRLSGGAGSRHSWGNRSWDSSSSFFNESVWERPASAEPDSPSSTKSASTTVWRRTESIETASMDSQLSADLTKTAELKSPLEEDEDLTSPASDLSAVERLIEEGNRQTSKASEESPMDDEPRSVSSRSSAPIPHAPKRPTRLTKTDKTATEHLLRRRRSSEANAAGKTVVDGADHQTKSAPTSPKRNGAVFNNTVNILSGRESPVESGDVWRRFAIAGAGGARDTASVSPAINRKTRSSSLQASSRTNRERSESPLLSRNRSLTPSTKRKTRPQSARSSHERESKKENVIMISRDSEGRHRLDSNSSCDSNDSQSVEGASSGRRTPDRSKSKRFGQKATDTATGGVHKRSLSGGKENTRSDKSRCRSTEPYPLTERQGQRPSSTGPYHTNGSSGRRRRTFHGDDPEHADAISKSLHKSAFSPPNGQRPSSTGPYHTNGSSAGGRRRRTLHDDDPEHTDAVSKSLHKSAFSPPHGQRPSSTGPYHTIGSSARRRRTLNGDDPEHTDAISKSLHNSAFRSTQRPSSTEPRESYRSPGVTRRPRRTTVHGDNAEHKDAISRSLQDHTSKERKHRPTSSGSRQSDGSPAATRRPRRKTVHGDNPEHANAISQSASENGTFRRKLPTPPDQFARRTTGNNVWRRTPDIFDEQLRSSLEARLGSSLYPRSRSGNSSPVNRTRPPSRLRPVTPVPRHMKVDSHVVTPMRRDDRATPTKIPMPVQHKRILDGSSDVRTRSLPDLIDLPRWLVRRIEMQSNDEYTFDNFDCAQSYCSSMDSVSPTPSVKAENPNDSGYEDNAAKSSPLSTLSFADEASPPDASVELPGQEVAESVGSEDTT
ncbi:uncharacterized protein [Amphiura filiformis]|uniref:uncharacterized protein n=1 Tax=Amphiura filiformis TaxID=82378 RepID=UPI003B210078